MKLRVIFAPFQFMFAYEFFADFWFNGPELKWNSAVIFAKNFSSK